MKKWLANVKIEVWDDYNNINKTMSVQVLVEASTYGKASMTADKYVLNHLLRNIGPIVELTNGSNVNE